jgi:hypothetical protein
VAVARARTVRPNQPLSEPCLSECYRPESWVPRQQGMSTLTSLGCPYAGTARITAFTRSGRALPIASNFERAR